MVSNGLEILIEAILHEENQRNLSGVKRKISGQEKRKAEKMRENFERENALHPGQKNYQKLLRFIDQATVPDIPPL